MNNNDNKRLVKVSQWCIENNAVDYLSVLNILKKTKTYMVKIGTDYYVESASVIETALTFNFLKQKERLENLRNAARERAAARREVEMAINDLLATGSSKEVLLDLLKNINKNSKQNDEGGNKI